jgi:hypothetical protein
LKEKSLNTQEKGMKTAIMENQDMGEVRDASAAKEHTPHNQPQLPSRQNPKASESYNKKKGLPSISTSTTPPQIQTSSQIYPKRSISKAKVTKNITTPLPCN